MTRVCAVLLWDRSSQLALIFNALILWQTPEVLKLLTHEKNKWCRHAGLVCEGILMGGPPGTLVKEPVLLLHTHPCSESTDNLLWGSIQLSSVCYHLLPPQLQFTALLAGLIEQIMGNLNASENCLNIKTTTTSWIEHVAWKICKQLCLSVHKLLLGANFGSPWSMVWMSLQFEAGFVELWWFKLLWNVLNNKVSSGTG